MSRAVRAVLLRRSLARGDPRRLRLMGSVGDARSVMTVESVRSF